MLIRGCHSAAPYFIQKKINTATYTPTQVGYKKELEAESPLTLRMITQPDCGRWEDHSFQCYSRGRETIQGLDTEG
ncbi:hypothetical protein PCCS19_09090 [Paenibacillus sp. CCS19]|nr:hypothetical protein PCCS19_09090 [Paenibacillus cellulosilyticus]